MRTYLRRRELPWVIVAAAVLILGVLCITGRLQFRSAGKGAESNADRAEKQSADISERVDKNVVRLQLNESKLADLKTEPAQEHELPAVVVLPGEVQVAENRLARITPSVAGVVRNVEKAVGDAVEKGSTLCVLESAELGDARAVFVEALSERDFAERNYERWKLLYEKGLRTQNEVYSVESDLTKAKIKVESSEARLRALNASLDELQRLQRLRATAVSNRFVVTSPLRGLVLDRTVTAGQSVDTKDQLFQLADLSTVWVVAAAHDADLVGLHPGLTAIVQSASQPDVSLSGALVSIGPQTDDKTRTVQVRVAVSNPSRFGSPLLRPGGFSTITIELAKKRPTLAIPSSAVQTDGNDSFIFVRLRAGKNSRPSTDSFERRAVKTGSRFGELIEIREGLRVGEVVVTKNGYLLKAEMQKTNPED